MTERIVKMNRVLANDDCTLGVLDAEGFSCCTLEDEKRLLKVDGETRIPAGTYQIKLREDSPMARRYRANFGHWHTGMLWLQDVPNFEWVYIHVGNDDEDTAGCVLVGRAMDVDMDTEWRVLHSRSTYVTLYELIKGWLDAGDPVFIQIEDMEI